MHDHETDRQVLIDRLRRAQAVAQVGSWELDLRTRTMWGSEEAFRLYGLTITPDQVLPLLLVQKVPLAEYRPLLDQALADLVAGRGRYDVEYEILRPLDGARRNIHSLAELCQRPGDAGPVVVGTLQDITARKTMEAALRVSEEQLRTEQRRLEAQLQLRLRMDSIGTLASGMAHDFNNILAAIQGYAELLRDETAGLAPNARQAADNVRAAAERAAGLVGRLRSLSRPDQQGTATFDLQPVVADVFQMLEGTTDRRIRKECGMARDTWLVRGTESDVYHALVHVALNAIQAIEDKGVSELDVVRVTACSHEAGQHDEHGLAAGRYVHVALSDTGTGMSAEVQTRAFDPLFSTKARGVRKGQGLGLTMVYHIVVTQHGGAITFDSREGHGTTVHLFLPAGSRPDAVVCSAPPVNTAPPTCGILIVEDEESVAGLMRQVLSRTGHRVLLAEDGVVGLEMFVAHGADIDLVILDQTLPRLSGIEVLRELSRLRPGVRVIMSSGDQVPVPDGLHAAVGFLPKPFSLADLKAAVRKALGWS